MISCTEYRRQLLAEPDSGSPLLREHSKSCAECADFSRRLQGFETKLRGALAVDLGVRKSAEVLPLRPRARAHSPARRWFALAASFAGAVGIGAFLWIGSARQSLAAAVVAHMAHEPDAWNTAGQQVSPAALAAVLRDA
ncbi:MAG: DUF3379 family protein, partial [Proteobacteria bacterium]|nr:DUF3379 family protein [Pseudomonadota bacterium]